MSETNSNDTVIAEFEDSADSPPASPSTFKRSPAALAAWLKLRQLLIDGGRIENTPLPRRLYLEAGLEPPADALPDESAADGDK
jgi:hypothetical protein